MRARSRAMARYEIEKDWDYAYLTVQRQPGCDEPVDGHKPERSELRQRHHRLERRQLGQPHRQPGCVRRPVGDTRLPLLDGRCCGRVGLPGRQDRRSTEQPTTRVGCSCRPRAGSASRPVRRRATTSTRISPRTGSTSGTTRTSSPVRTTSAAPSGRTGRSGSRTRTAFSSGTGIRRSPTTTSATIPAAG